jgi:hypothetical protein
MLSKIRAHHWAILIAVVVALVIWLARPRPAGGPASTATNPPAANPANPAHPDAAHPAASPPGRASLRRQAAAAQVAEDRRHHDDVATRIHQAQAAGAKQTLDGPYIKGRIQELQPLLKECYELALRERPNLAGRLVLSFDIVGEPSLGGIVESLEFVGSDGGIVDTNLQECVRATVETQTFAPPESGGRVKVTYPFVFAHDKEKEK